ncbi:MAG: ATP-grasp domain-containing protein [Bacteroidota bacterium]
MKKKQVFIVGLDDFNLKKLNKLSEAENCEFHAALSISEMRDVDQFDMEKLINLCFERIDAHGQIDAVASYYDFPGTMLVPVIAEKYGLPGPSLESMTKCENKYWSRLEQAKVIADHIPQFKAFDPFDDSAYEKLNMIAPFWVKPIKSFRSFLAYRINGEAQFYENMEEVKKHIEFISEPFNYLMKKYNMPMEFTDMPERCIAESPITGHQCTVEGYVSNGNVVVYGIVDSIREGDRSSFSRYEYPSSLPQEIQFRMADVTRRVIQQIGLDHTPFNIEYFYNPTADEVYLLEINPRISQAHTDIFEKIHGISHHLIMLNIALGNKPKTLGNNGEFNKAANFMLRTFEPGIVRKVPTDSEIRILKKFIPSLEVKIRVKENTNLSDLQGQDSYSYELANIFIGGRDQKELVDRYNQCLQGLTFDIEHDNNVQLF